MIRKILCMLETFLSEDITDATSFSIELEDALCDYYTEMETENSSLAAYLNEDLPDICASYEIGMDMAEFKKVIQEIYENAIKLL